MTIAEKHMTPAVEEFMRGLFAGHIAGEVEAVAVAKVFSETCQSAIDEALGLYEAELDLLIAHAEGEWKKALTFAKHKITEIKGGKI